VFLAFFGKDVLGVFFNMGLLRVVTLPILRVERLKFWFERLFFVKRVVAYKYRIVEKANSGLMGWQVLFFLTIFTLSFIPVPYLQTIAVGLYILAFFSERNFAKLLGHYPFHALILGSFLKYIVVVYTNFFDNIFFIQF